jgi:type III pantothenate kinase
VTIEWPDNLIANNTDDAIRSGLLFGFKSELESLVSLIKKEFNKDDIPVFATGGWGKTIAKRTHCIDTYDPYLTLHGIRLVAIHGEDAAEIDEEGDEE